LRHLLLAIGWLLTLSFTTAHAITGSELQIQRDALKQDFEAAGLSLSELTERAESFRLSVRAAIHDDPRNAQWITRSVPELFLRSGLNRQARDLISEFVASDVWASQDALDYYFSSGRWVGTIC
jgi:hypothetical protein